MTWPEAEVNIGESLIAELLADQHPELAGLDLLEVASGFDNSIWRLGSDLVVRLPRRAAAVPLMLNELKWLPRFAPQLPLTISAPIRRGEPSALFEWPWSVALWIEGIPGNTVDVATAGASATLLGTFLRSLHQPAPVDAPTNLFRGVSLRALESAFTTRLRAIDAGVLDHAVVSDLWESAASARPAQTPPVWIHGDMHPANAIFHDGRLVGVIDFGDLCGGDPATDLAGALLSLPFEALAAFFTAYGEVDRASVRRTIGWALHFGVMFILLGASDEPTYGPIGQRAIENSVALAQSL